MTNLLPKIAFPELFFGLVAPIGANIDTSIAALKENLESFDYEVVDIRVTDLFPKFIATIKPEVPLKEKPKCDRYQTYIQYGNQLRKKFEDNSILAMAAMYQVAEKRKEIMEANSAELPTKIAYVMRQFKRPEEIELLRSVYGEQFFQISIYSRRDFRVQHLSENFAKDEGLVNPDVKKSIAENLVLTDENEDGSNGQKVGKIFHHADLIIDADEVKEEFNASKQVERFTKLLFGSNSISPSRYEYGMKLAKSAALRSIDLSRQVGAAIFSKTGQIISLGSNEVPKAGGGSYWDKEGKDAREYSLGVDSNEERKRELLSEVMEIFNLKVTQEIKEKLNNAQLMDALEYGRVVHAEMSAITDAARGGLAVKDSVLYCTTFPCHMCAKHIIAAGISKVIFLEPYPKSLVGRQHIDSIDVEGKNRGKYKEYTSVKFVHFYGVTPKRFDELFYRGKRKNNIGQYEKYTSLPATPMLTIRNLAYLDVEHQVVEGATNNIFKS
ncbi:MAG: dCMP deaminase [Robiginitomaculum sp.]|nr:MAG: dCMP deaminase [Robiginitomaculum sp.]